MKALQYLNKYFYKYRTKLFLGFLITIVARIFSLFAPRLIGNSLTAVERYLKSEAKDDEWKNFPAKLIHQTKTDVLPIYFDGKNGLLFHIFASKLKNQTLKYSTYIHETRKKIGKEINIYSGDLIKYNDISHIEDRQELTKYLKTLTYNLKFKR